jgi:hypothetical protein
MRKPNASFPTGLPGGGNAFRRQVQQARLMAQGRPREEPVVVDPVLAEQGAFTVAAIEDFLRLARQTMLHATPPPWLERPYQSIGIDAVGTLALGTSAPFTTVVSQAVGAGLFGVIRGVGVDLDALSGFTADVTWRIVVNGAPVAPYSSVAFQLGTITDLRETMIVVSGGQTVALQAANSSGGTSYTFTGCLYGWIWPPTEAGSTGSFRDVIAD